MVLGELKDLVLDIDVKENLQKKIVDHFMKEYEKVKNIMEVGVVTATVARGELSAFNLNKLIKEAYNPIEFGKDAYVEVKVDKYNKYLLSEGDKILITKNNYKAQIYNEKNNEFEDGAIFNGNLGIVTKIGTNYIEADIKGIGLVRIENKDYGTIQLGYACTCHKLQGGQMKSIIIGIDMSAYMLLSVEWFYTALTRAEDYCIVVGEPQALHRGCSNKQGNTKTTFLKEFLIEGNIA
jgi:ATP-dependent exoDNAse (exonuclease V) alpha subunit